MNPSSPCTGATHSEEPLLTLYWATHSDEPLLTLYWGYTQ